MATIGYTPFFTAELMLDVYVHNNSPANSQ